MRRTIRSTRYAATSKALHDTSFCEKSHQQLSLPPRSAKQHFDHIIVDPPLVSRTFTLQPKPFYLVENAQTKLIPAKLSAKWAKLAAIIPLKTAFCLEEVLDPHHTTYRTQHIASNYPACGDPLAHCSKTSTCLPRQQRLDMVMFLQLKMFSLTNPRKSPSRRF